MATYDGPAVQMPIDPSVFTVPSKAFSSHHSALWPEQAGSLTIAQFDLCEPWRETLSSPVWKASTGGVGCEVTVMCGLYPFGKGHLSCVQCLQRPVTWQHRKAQPYPSQTPICSLFPQVNRNATQTRFICCGLSPVPYKVMLHRPIFIFCLAASSEQGQVLMLTFLMVYFHGEARCSCCRH